MQQFPSEDFLNQAVEPLREFIGQRRAIRSSIFKAVTHAVLEIAEINKEDFFAFAAGRIDRLGNYIALDDIEVQQDALDYFREANVHEFFEERFDVISETADRERELLRRIEPFLLAFRDTVRALQRYLKDTSGQMLEESPGQMHVARGQEVLDCAQGLSEEYSAILGTWGSLCNLVESFELEVVDVRSPAFLDHVWSLTPRPSLDIATGSICCQTNMSCESDTVDCGLFDYCNKDPGGCGSECWFYDSSGCKCNVEDT